MSYFVLGILTCIAIAAVIVGCRSCFRSGDTGNGGIHKSATVPKDIADAKLLSYSYTKHGTTRWPLHSERVERCEEDSTKCVIRLQSDTLVVSADVLAHIKQLIIEAEAWRFKDNYRPHMEIMDGWSWGFSAVFECTESVSSRRHGRLLTSSGSNAAPDTELFKKVREYLEEIIEKEKKGSLMEMKK